MKITAVYFFVVAFIFSLNISGCATGGSAYANVPNTSVKGGDANLTIFGKSKKKSGEEISKEK